MNTIQLNGLKYFTDEVDIATQHTVSVYHMYIEGQLVFKVFVDNDESADLPDGVDLPEGVTAHPMVVMDAAGTKTLQTKGVAMRQLHVDGVHVDGMTVQSYVYPRLARLLVQLYDLGE
jgi:hypothetical protein